MIKVTMNLTERDVQNAEVIRVATDARSRAQGVSVALALTRFVIEELVTNPGTKIQLRHEDGSVERVVMPELQNLGGVDLQTLKNTENSVLQEIGSPQEGVGE